MDSWEKERKHQQLDSGPARPGPFSQFIFLARMGLALCVLRPVFLQQRRASKSVINQQVGKVQNRSLKPTSQSFTNHFLPSKPASTNQVSRNSIL